MKNFFLSISYTAINSLSNYLKSSKLIQTLNALKPVLGAKLLETSFKLPAPSSSLTNSSSVTGTRTNIGLFSSVTGSGSGGSLLVMRLNSLMSLRSRPFLASQVRFVQYGREYQPNTLKRKRSYGFLARLKSIGGRKILKRRMMKGRKTLSH